MPLELNGIDISVVKQHRGFGEVKEGFLQGKQVANLGFVTGFDRMAPVRGGELPLSRELAPANRFQKPHENISARAFVHAILQVGKFALQFVITARR